MKHKLVCGRLLAGALVVALSATSIPATYVVQAEEITYFKDGTYTGVGKGRKGDQHCGYMAAHTKEYGEELEEFIR